MKNLVLTGFMASGKSEVGKLVAELLGYELIDTDNVVVENEGMSINQIFENCGEEYFRNAESEAIKSVAQKKGVVISTGGGAVLRRENIDELRKSGVVIYLAVDFVIIADRIQEARKTRPLLKNQSLEQIKERFDSRQVFYNNCDYKFEITQERPPLENAKCIVEIYKSYMN